MWSTVCMRRCPRREKNLGILETLRRDYGTLVVRLPWIRLVSSNITILFPIIKRLQWISLCHTFARFKRDWIIRSVETVLEHILSISFRPRRGDFDPTSVGNLCKKPSFAGKKFFMVYPSSGYGLFVSMDGCCGLVGDSRLHSGRCTNHMFHQLCARSIRGATYADASLWKDSGQNIDHRSMSVNSKGLS